VPEDRRIQFRVGIHVGDVVEESDGDLMGDGVNIAARFEGGRQAQLNLPLRAGLRPDSPDAVDLAMRGLAAEFRVSLQRATRSRSLSMSAL